jgi:hypothetical protein
VAGVAAVVVRQAAQAARGDELALGALQNRARLPGVEQFGVDGERHHGVRTNAGIGPGFRGVARFAHHVVRVIGVVAPKTRAERGARGVHRLERGLFHAGMTVRARESGQGLAAFGPQRLQLDREPMARRHRLEADVRVHPG